MVSFRDLSRSIASSHAFPEGVSGPLAPREEIKTTPASNALSCCRIESLRQIFYRHCDLRLATNPAKHKPPEFQLLVSNAERLGDAIWAE
jgi:hypothetical protein